MTFEVHATYENNTLRLDQPLPLQESERVVVVVKSTASRIRQSAGLIPLTCDQAARDYLLGPDNHPWSE